MDEAPCKVWLGGWALGLREEGAGRLGSGSEGEGATVGPAQSRLWGGPGKATSHRVGGAHYYGAEGRRGPRCLAAQLLPPSLSWLRPGISIAPGVLC